MQLDNKVIDINERCIIELVHLTLAFITLISILLLFGTLQFTFQIYWLKSNLQLTRENWWGILTCALIHETPSHLHKNIEGIIQYTIPILTFLILFNLCTNKHPKLTVPKLYLSTIIVSQITSGTATYIILYIIIQTEIKVTGSSGITYGLAGLTTAIFFSTLILLHESNKKLKSELKRSFKSLIFITFTLITTLTLSAIPLAELLHNTAEFMGATNKGANVFAHGFGYLSGLAIGIIHILHYI